MRIKHILTGLVAFILWIGLLTPFKSQSSPFIKEKMTLLEAIEKISKQYDVYFTFDMTLVSKVEVDYEQSLYSSAEDALVRVLKGTGLKYKFFDHRFVIIYKDDAKGLESLKKMSKHLSGLIREGENKFEPIGKKEMLIVRTLPERSVLEDLRPVAFSVEGTVVNNEGEALVGVTVQVKGTNRATTTDANGHFSLTDIEANAVLVISYVGFETQEVRVGGQANLKITMVSADQALEQVVVVGYGTQKKHSLTGAISSMKGNEISETPVSNISHALAGKLAGVSMSYGSGNGEPGKNPSIRVRGIGTIGNSNPLVVIDGVSGRSMNDIAPESIEDISILKDAAAVAPYGLAGANGVILITTKEGKKSSPASITLNIQPGVQRPSVFPRFLNSRDFMTLANEAYLNDNPNGSMLPYDIETIKNYDNLNDQDPDLYPESDFDQLFEKNISLGIYDLSFSGGSDKITYNTGFRYYNEGYILKKDLIADNNIYFNRINYHVNLAYDATNSTKIIIKSINYFDSNRGIDASRTPTSVFYSRYMYPAVVPLYFSNGLWGMYNQESIPAVINSGGYSVSKTNTKYNSVIVQQQLPIKGLSIKGVLNFDNSTIAIKNLHRPFYYYSINYNTQPYTFSKQLLTYQTQAYTWLRETRSLSNRMDIQGIINYKKEVRSHFIEALFVYETQKNSMDMVSAYRQRFAVDIDELSMGSADKNDFDNSGTSNSGTQLSYVYRVVYNFKNKYLFETNGRYDGHYYFAPGRKWAYFPSFSAGWRISEEDFLRDNNVLTNLKIRGSWGKSGNLAGSAFQYLSGYLLTSNYAFGNDQMVTGAYTNIEPNPLITWEKSSQTDLGIEATLWNRLNIEMDYFNGKRNGMLLFPDVMVPAEYGIALAQENKGRMKNQGFEITVGSEFYSKNGIGIELSGNLSFARNKMIELFENANTYDNPNRRRTGRPFDTPFGYKAIGIFSTNDDKNNDGKIDNLDGYNISQVYGTAHPGDIKFEDVSGPDGVPDGKIDLNDEIVIGYPRIPELTYGFNLAANWKGFRLDMFFQGSSRFSVDTRGGGLDPFDNNLSNVYYEYFDNRWINGTRENAKYPRAQFGRQWGYATDLFNPDVAFLRCKTFSLSYVFPKRISQNLFMKNLRLYLIGQNLITFSNLRWLDPETAQGGQNAYPLMKSLSVGVNITL